MANRPEITELLNAANSGDAAAGDAAYAIVYDELKRSARRQSALMAGIVPVAHSARQRAGRQVVRKARGSDPQSPPLLRTRGTGDAPDHDRPRPAIARASSVVAASRMSPWILRISARRPPSRRLNSMPRLLN
jgi:hypothetical protein